MSRPATGRRIDVRRSQIYDGARAFTPASLPGLILWLRADLGITLAGAKVSAWADQSGNGADFAQGVDAFRPTYVASNTSMGNKPSMTFTSGTLGLSRTDFALGLGAVTMGVFYRRSALTTAARVFGPASAAGGNFNLVTNGVTGFDVTQTDGGSNIVRVSPDAVSTNYSRIAAVNAASAATVDPVVYTNGVAGGSALLSTAVNGSIGAGLWYTGYVFEGDVTEVFAYNRILTAAEAAQLAAYQIARYT